MTPDPSLRSVSIVMLALCGIAMPQVAHGMSRPEHAAPRQVRGDASAPPPFSPYDLLLRRAGLTRAELTSPEMLQLVAATVFDDPRGPILSVDQRRQARAFLSVIGYRPLPAAPPDVPSIVASCTVVVGMSEEQRAHFEDSILASVIEDLAAYGDRVRDAYAISLLHHASLSGHGEVDPATPSRLSAYEDAIEATIMASQALHTAILRTAEILTPHQQKQLTVAAEVVRQSFLLRSSGRTGVPAANLDPVVAYCLLEHESATEPRGFLTPDAEAELTRIVEERSPLIDHLMDASLQRFRESIPVVDSLINEMPITATQVASRKRALARGGRAELDLARSAVAAITRLKTVAPDEHQGPLQAALDAEFADIAAISPRSAEAVLNRLRSEHDVALDARDEAAARALVQHAEAERDRLMSAYLQFFAAFRGRMTMSPTQRAEGGRTLSAAAAPWHRASTAALEQIHSAVCGPRHVIDEAACRELQEAIRESQQPTARFHSYAEDSIAPWIRRLSMQVP